MSIFRFILLLLVLPLFTLLAQPYKVIESTREHIIIEFDFTNYYSVTDTLINGRSFSYIDMVEFTPREPGEPWLPEVFLNLGVPKNSNPVLNILSSEQIRISDKFIIPFPLEDPDYNPDFVDNFDKDIYNSNQLFPIKNADVRDDFIFRYLRVLLIGVSPYQFNPVSKELLFTKKLRIQLDYNIDDVLSGRKIQDTFTREHVQDLIINNDMIDDWIVKDEIKSNKYETFWYNSNQNYYKIFLSEKGVYRITFDELVSAGLPLGNGVPVEQIALYSKGESVPLDIVGVDDGTFNSGDYFQFVGFPPPPTDYATLNIYNTSNVYWFTYQNSNAELRYNDVNGLSPTFIRTVDKYYHVEHFEEDKLYERWGLAGNGNRDHWQWGRAIARNQQAVSGFESFYPPLENMNTDSNFAVLKVNMHGVTANRWCPTHKANIFLANNELIGTITWDGQTEVTFEKRIDSIKVYPTGNRLSVFVNGDVCPPQINPDDEIRINWFQFEYWRYLRTNPNYFTFTSNKNENGANRYWLSRWQRDEAKVYIPSKAKLITNPEILNDQFNSLRFVDTVFTPTEYFVVAPDYYLSVDSIKADIPSDLKSLDNAADYIIITHREFKSVAEELKDFRSSDFPDTTIQNPRIFIAEIDDIYDEFSYGLLAPDAIQAFVKYAFENWIEPAPSYVVLLGDMSYDYRGKISTSRRNFIPSIPFYTPTYGQAASDNMFVAVSGTDVIPDLAIGRLSIENTSEGTILLEKIRDYPADDSKAWKQNVLLFASGISLDDELLFGFNDASDSLEAKYLKPYGYTTSKVFRYPSKIQHEPFQGDGTKIRQAINEGGVLVNYYGHGGGYQWDLIFTNDDIYILENGGRLPFISSVTCYTAHFDNQDVFGEQFNKVPGKGSISFFGSSGLTYWNIGKDINQRIFNQIFNLKHFITGKSILRAKAQVPGVGAYGTQVALLTLLGDPVLKLALPSSPDFEIKSTGIKITPQNPLVGDTVDVQVKIRNYGRTFPDDSVSVELTATSSDSSYSVGIQRMTSFAANDSIIFKWVPETGGLIELTATINHIDIIEEEDYTDNSASNLFVVFNISEPNIVKPIDGYTSESLFEFLIVDIGYFIDLSLVYYIEIDTSFLFTNPIIQTGGITSSEGIIRWLPETLQPGTYFWRTRIFDGENYGRWSDVRSFTMGSDIREGYYAHSEILQTFDTYNIVYSDEHKSLILNTELIPPRPSNKTFIEQFNFTEPAYADSFQASTMTTDGTYLYFGTAQYFAYNPDTNPLGYSRIHKVGTGQNGTIKGEYYGYLPNFYDQILNQIFYHGDGNIYVATKNPYRLIKIDKISGDTSSVFLTDGLLRWEDASVQEGAYYLTSDGNYVYNLTIYDSLGNTRYVLRTLDPANNWTKTREDITLGGSSYVPGFSDFFIYDNYIFPTDYWQNAMRRIRLSDGFFEEEWATYLPFQNFYSWSFDWTNNIIYAVTFRPFSNLKTKFYTFIGTYTDAEGTITTSAVGPASSWKNLSYDLETPSITGTFTTKLLGFNNNTKQWDTLASAIPSTYDLSHVSASEYSSLKLNFMLSDSSFGASEPMKLKSVGINFDVLPEVMLARHNISVTPDSIMQGFETELSLIVQNISPIPAQDVAIKFYLNEADSAFFEPVININGDSTVTLNYTIHTDKLIFENDILVYAFPTNPDMFSFNNRTNESFFVIRDSLKPNFNITFDGKEILNGDIISSKPMVVMTLEDNSPLPLTPDMFTIIHQNVALKSDNPDLTWNYSGYPNSKMEVIWTPTLDEGRHTLEVLAKDSSGNFFDSTSNRSVFYVYSDADIRNVYNYPNPFKSNTHFTFELRGTTIPEELRIKIFTIAGRLIREITIPPDQMHIGFNQFYWDGKDEDGDEIANGLYFYKVISRQEGETRTVTQKLAKVN